MKAAREEKQKIAAVRILNSWSQYIFIHFCSLIWVLQKQHEQKDQNDHKQLKYQFVFS